MYFSFASNSCPQRSQLWVFWFIICSHLKLVWLASPLSQVYSTILSLYPVWQRCFCYALRLVNTLVTLPGRVPYLPGRPRASRTPLFKDEQTHWLRKSLRNLLFGINLGFLFINCLNLPNLWLVFSYNQTSPATSQLWEECWTVVVNLVLVSNTLTFSHWQLPLLLSSCTQSTASLSFFSFVLYSLV